MVEISAYKLDGEALPRRLFVLKGKTFDTSKRKYFFLVHDAQNFFADQYTSHGNSWKIEAALEKIGLSNYLVAGLECQRGFKRFKGYAPLPLTTVLARRYKVDPAAVFGRQYLSLLTARLIPDLEAKYQFRFQEVRSCMIGSSMGGVITTYAAFQKPQLYHGFIAFSPALFATRPHLQAFISAQPQINNYFYSMGGKETTGAIANADEYKAGFNFLKSAIKLKKQQNVQSYYTPTGIHSEKAWSQLLPIALEWFTKLAL